MNKKYITAAVILVFCAVFVFALANGNSDDSPSEISPSVSEPEPEPVPPEPEIVLPLYDGEFGSLDNGDSYYTPDIVHAVTDPGRAVIYYNNLLLAFTEGDLSEEEQSALSRSVGGETIGVISGALHAIQIRVNDSDLAGLGELAAKLMTHEKVLYACAEYPVQIMSTEADENPWNSYEPDYDLGNEAKPEGNDWWAEAIGAYTAWKYSDFCGEISVGIVDNGFSPEHEDFSGNINIITPENTNTPADHGTLVSGIIGAADNDVGIRGIADFASLYCADLWPTEDPDSYHTLTEYLAVINYMAQSGVKVVNNSWGCIIPSFESWEESTYGYATGSNSDEYWQWVDDRLYRDLIPTAKYCIVMISQLISSGYEDILMVQAAGNGFDNGRLGFDSRSLGFYAGITESVFNSLEPSVLEKLNTRGITYESIDERIIIVGAVLNERDPDGNYYMTSFSNYGETVDICAPGSGIFSTLVTGYGSLGGTSLSAPMVTGSAAFIWSLDPTLTAPQVRQILLQSAVCRAVGFINSEGWSYPMLNVGAAAEFVYSQNN